MPLIDKYRDMGTVVMGKIESGSVRRGETLMVMPNKVNDSFGGSRCFWTINLMFVEF